MDPLSNKTQPRPLPHNQPPGVKNAPPTSLIKFILLSHHNANLSPHAPNKTPKQTPTPPPSPPINPSSHPKVKYERTIRVGRNSRNNNTSHPKNPPPRGITNPTTPPRPGVSPEKRELSNSDMFPRKQKEFEDTVRETLRRVALGRVGAYEARLALERS